MTRYDTSAQARLRESSRRLNLVFAAVLAALATWIVASYVVLYLSLFPPSSTFELVLGLLIYCLAAIPLSQAFIRRPHPESVDVRAEGLILRFRKADPMRIAWEDRPVSMAYDDRELRERRRGQARSEGMEVQVYIPRPGRDSGSETFRPLELELSGEAFDDIRQRMRGAGFQVRERAWNRRRPGEMVEFLRKGDPGFGDPAEERPAARPLPRAGSRRTYGGKPGRSEAARDRAGGPRS